MKPASLTEVRKYCARPERIVWAVAKYEDQCSICPLGWKMNCSGSPQMMAISVAPGHLTHELIAKSGEFVLAWPGADLAEATMLCGTKSGRDVDKFAETGLTALAAAHVRAPLVAECIANLECRVAGRLTAGDHTIFSGEILKVWLNDEPARLLCSVDESSGYELLLQRGAYRFGTVSA